MEEAQSSSASLAVLASAGACFSEPELSSAEEVSSSFSAGAAGAGSVGAGVSASAGVAVPVSAGVSPSAGVACSVVAGGSAADSSAAGSAGAGVSACAAAASAAVSSAGVASAGAPAAAGAISSPLVAGTGRSGSSARALRGTLIKTSNAIAMAISCSSLLPSVFLCRFPFVRLFFGLLTDPVLFPSMVVPPPGIYAHEI